MIQHSDIENVIGTDTMLTDAMQTAIQDWYAAAIDGTPLNKDPDTLSMGWPAAICAELARLTTLELDATVEGSPRADWINEQLRKVLSPRRRRVLSVALALGSGVWKPYQAGEKIGVYFVPATSYYPVSFDVNEDLTEAVFIDQIAVDDNYYNRLEWLHVLTGPEDYRDKERDFLERIDRDAAATYPCVQVISRAYRSGSKDALGSEIALDARPEWADIEPVAYLPGLEKIPVGYFVTPIVNTVDPTSDLGAAIFAPATAQIIDADVQYTRLDWEYEGGELAVDMDENYLKPAGAVDGSHSALYHPGVPCERTAAKHRDRLYHGLDVNTGIAQSAPFYQVFAPSLRDSNYLSGLNQYIRNIESHAGLSFGTFSQVSEVEKTATEIMSSKQKLYSTVSDLQAALEDALNGLIDALDFWADQCPDAPGRGQINRTFHWDDSIVIDRMTEMAQWQQEVTMGLRSRTEYRQHFYGEDEATAAQAIAAITQENSMGDILKGVIESGQNQNADE